VRRVYRIAQASRVMERRTVRIAMTTISARWELWVVGAAVFGVADKVVCGDGWAMAAVSWEMMET
jgi:hypothetical protein